MDANMQNFYKAAQRAGMSYGVPEVLRAKIQAEVEAEENDAPMPSAVTTPKVTPRVREVGAPANLRPRVSGGCSGGVCSRDLAGPKVEHQELTVTPRCQQQPLDESADSRYFTSDEIEQIKIDKLQEIADCDRKKVMSVLTPVVSLLDGLHLSAPEDQTLVADIKKKLSNVGGMALSSPPAPSVIPARRKGPIVDHSFLRGYRTSAIAPRQNPDAVDAQPNPISPSASSESLEREHPASSACCGFLQSIQNLLPREKSSTTPRTPTMLDIEENPTPDDALAHSPPTAIPHLELVETPETPKLRTMEISDIHPRILHQQHSFVTKRIPIHM